MKLPYYFSIAAVFVVLLVATMALVAHQQRIENAEARIKGCSEVIDMLIKHEQSQNDLMISLVESQRQHRIVLFKHFPEDSTFTYDPNLNLYEQGEP